MNIKARIRVSLKQTGLIEEYVHGNLTSNSIKILAVAQKFERLRVLVIKVPQQRQAPPQ